MQQLSPPPPPPPPSPPSGDRGSGSSSSYSLVQQFRSMVSFHDLWTNILTFSSPSDLQAFDATCSVARSLTRICWSYLLGHKKIQLLTFTKRDDFVSEKARVVSSWCKHTRNNKGKFIITGDFQRPSSSSLFDIESGTSTRFNDQYGLGTLGSSCQATDVAGNKLLMGGWKSQGDGECTTMIYALRGDGRSGRRRFADNEIEAEEQKMSESGSSAGALSSAITASGGGGGGRGAKQDLHWVEFASLPLPLSYASATTMVDGRVMVTGGGSSPYQGSDVYADCYISCIGESSHEYSINLQERLQLSRELDEEEQHTVALSSSSGGDDGSHGGDMNSDADESDWEDLVDEVEFDYNWKRIAPMKTARCGHVSLTLFDNSLVSIGGYLGGTSYLASVEVMDPGTGEWHSLPDMSCPRTAPGAAVCEHGSIYVFGGSTDGTIGLNSCIRLDNRESIGWAGVGDMTERRGYGGHSLGPGNRFYASGGLHNSVLKGTMEYFDPRKSVWTQVDVSGDGSSEARHPFSPASLSPWRSNKHLMRSGHQMIYLWEG